MSDLHTPEVRQIYIAVYAQVEDGRLTYVATDYEALIGSYDGHVWNVNEQRWQEDEPESEAYSRLGQALDALNRDLEDGLRPIP